MTEYLAQLAGWFVGLALFFYGVYRFKKFTMGGHMKEWIELNNNTIGDIGLWVTAQEGKFLWTTDPADDTKWEYIPEDLYREIVKFEKERRGIWHGQ